MLYMKSATVSARVPRQGISSFGYDLVPLARTSEPLPCAGALLYVHKKAAGGSQRLDVPAGVKLTALRVCGQSLFRSMPVPGP